MQRGVNIAGQILDVDPRTGKTEVNHAKPFSKASWLEPAKPHTVTVQCADGTTSSVMIVGATHAELRDDAFIHALVTGQSMSTITEKLWHGFVMRLANKHPDKVATRDSIRPMIKPPRSRVIVSTRSVSRS
jgi:hypothetical protein